MIEFLRKCLDIVFFPLTATNDIILLPFYIIFVTFLFILFFSLVRGRK